MDSKIEELFGKLDRWRHLPAYQLERRADIFFSLYLHEVLEWKLGRMPQHIIPEFPVRASIEDPASKSNLSDKIDYLAVMHDPAGLVFVELKTDSASIRSEQIEYLLAARAAQKKDKWALLSGLQKISAATSAKKKYRWLLKELSEAGLIDLSPKGTFEPRKDLPDPLEAEIVFIKPNADPVGHGISVIPFDEVAEIVATHGDDLSIRFAQSLREWAGVKAGYSHGVG